MKYCPNTGCPFLYEVGIVAEYQNDIDLCRECGTDLVEGAAPILQPSDLPHNSLPDDSVLQTVATVESFSEAKWLKDELEQTRIAAKIVVAEQDPLDLETESNIDTESPLFDVQVLAHHVVPAMDIINHLLTEDELDNEDEIGYLDGDESDDEWNFDEDRGEEHVNEVSGMGNNFLLFAMFGVVLLALAALIYGFASF